MTEPSTSEVAPPKALVALAGGLLVATGVYGIGFWALHDSGPPESAFAPAADAIRAQFAGGDLVVLAPFYATRAREYLGDLHPIAVRRVLGEDLGVRSRIWVFGLFGAERGVGRDLESVGFELGFSERFEGIGVLRYDRPARERVTYDFVPTVRQARVHHDQGGRHVPCNRWENRNQQGGPPGRWVCPKDGEWFYVAPEWHRMGDHLRRCLWAHPPNQGRLTISFPDVPLRGVLAGRAGHTLNSSRRARAPVHLDVTIGNAPPQRLTFALDDHFRPFRIKVPTATTATVTFSVSSPDAGVNHFCFAADVRQAEAPVVPSKETER